MTQCLPVVAFSNPLNCLSLMSLQFPLMLWSSSLIHPVRWQFAGTKYPTMINLCIGFNDNFSSSSTDCRACHSKLIFSYEIFTTLMQCKYQQAMMYDAWQPTTISLCVCVCTRGYQFSFDVKLSLRVFVQHHFFLSLSYRIASLNMKKHIGWIRSWLWD